MSQAKLVEDGTASSTHFLLRSFTKAASSLTYTFEGTYETAGRNISFQWDDAAGNGVGASVNLATGALIGSFSTFGTGWTAVSAAVTAQTTGGYNVVLKFTTNSATTLRLLALLLDGSSNYSRSMTKKNLPPMAFALYLLAS